MEPLSRCCVGHVAGPLRPTVAQQEEAHVETLWSGHCRPVPYVLLELLSLVDAAMTTAACCTGGQVCLRAHAGMHKSRWLLGGTEVVVSAKWAML